MNDVKGIGNIIDGGNNNQIKGQGNVIDGDGFGGSFFGATSSSGSNSYGN